MVFAKSIIFLEEVNISKEYSNSYIENKLPRSCEKKDEKQRTLHKTQLQYWEKRTITKNRGSSKGNHDRKYQKPRVIEGKSW